MKPVLATLTGAVATAATCLAIFVLVSPSGPSASNAPTTPTSTVSMKPAPSLADALRALPGRRRLRPDAEGQRLRLPRLHRPARSSPTSTSSTAPAASPSASASTARRCPRAWSTQDATTDLAVLDVADSAVGSITPLTLGSSSGLQRRPVGDRDRLAVRPLRHADLGHRLRPRPRHPVAQRQHDLRRRPDRRGDQPRQLGRPAARRDRPGDRDQLPDRHRVGLQQRRRLRDPGRHRPPVCSTGLDGALTA